MALTAVANQGATYSAAMSVLDLEAGVLLAEPVIIDRTIKLIQSGGYSLI